MLQCFQQDAHLHRTGVEAKADHTVIGVAAGDLAGQVRLALARVTQREPTAGEVERGLDLIRRLREEDGATSWRYAVREDYEPLNRVIESV